MDDFHIERLVTLCEFLTICSHASSSAIHTCLLSMLIFLFYALQAGWGGGGHEFYNPKGLQK